LAAWSALIAAILFCAVTGLALQKRKGAKHSALAGRPVEPAGTPAAGVRTPVELTSGAIEFAAAQRRLAVVAERERFADDLRDRPVHEVFALGLALSSAASRHPEMAELFAALIDRTDRIIAQLREVVVDAGGAAAGTPTSRNRAAGGTRLVAGCSGRRSTLGGVVDPNRPVIHRSGLGRRFAADRLSPAALTVDDPATATDAEASRPGRRLSAIVPTLPVMAIARYPVLALDCPDPKALAEFYGALLDWKIESSDDDWCTIRAEYGDSLAFQKVDPYQAPQWPGQERPQQMHLDVTVDDLDQAERAVLALGATKHDHQPGTTFRVFLDPAGHPFCLCVD
jgi:predicted enzyme related to lactoylglutathione lyase